MMLKTNGAQGSSQVQRAQGTTDTLAHHRSWKENVSTLNFKCHEIILLIPMQELLQLIQRTDELFKPLSATRHLQTHSKCPLTL